MKLGRQAWLMLGSFACIAGASVCCVAPLVALSLGIGSVVGASWFAEGRPYFLAVVVVLLAAAWLFALRRTRVACACEDGQTQAKQRKHKTVLAGITAVALLAMILPWLMAGKQAAAGTSIVLNGSELLLRIPSINCAPDAKFITAKLQQRPGVLASEVDYRERRAAIRYDPQRISPAVIIAAITEAGFKAEPETSKNTMPTYEIEDVPVTCGLMPAELKEREASLLTEFAQATRGSMELADGFSFKLEPTDAVLKLASELIIAESQCCPFLQFRLIATQRRREVWMEIRGPGEAKALLREILPQLAFANGIE